MIHFTCLKEGNGSVYKGILSTRHFVYIHYVRNLITV